MRDVTLPNPSLGVSVIVNTAPVMAPCRFLNAARIREEYTHYCLEHKKKGDDQIPHLETDECCSFWKDTRLT